MSVLWVALLTTGALDFQFHLLNMMNKYWYHKTVGIIQLNIYSKEISPAVNKQYKKSPQTNANKISIKFITSCCLLSM